MAGLPIDFTTQFDQVKQREAVAAAMLARAQQPRQDRVAGGQVVRSTSSEVLAPIVSQLAGQFLQGQAAKKRAELEKLYKVMTAADMNSFMTGTRNPDPAAQQEAVVKALSSESKEVRNAAQKFKFDTLKLADLAKNATPASVLAAGGSGNPADLVAKADLGTVGGTVYDKGTLQKVQIGGAPAPLTRIDGDLYQPNSAGELRKLDNAPTTNINTALNPADTAAFKGIADHLGGLREQADISQATLGTVDMLEGLLLDYKDGTYSNVTAPMATALANAAEAAGLKFDATKLGNTEAYNALIIDLWQQKINAGGGNRGVVKEEATEIKKQLPLVVHSPEARAYLLGVMKRKAVGDIKALQEASALFKLAKETNDPTIYHTGKNWTKSASVRKETAPKGDEAAAPATKPIPIKNLTPEQRAKVQQYIQSLGAP